MADKRNTQTRQRQVRQEALRDFLANQKHIEHVERIIKKLLDMGEDMTRLEVKRYEVALNSKFKLINKYLPDLRSTEVVHESAGELDRRDLEQSLLKLVRTGVARGDQPDSSDKVH